MRNALNSDLGGDDRHPVDRPAWTGRNVDRDYRTFQVGNCFPGSGEVILGKGGFGMIEQFLDREDRRRQTLSQHELERRWKAVRERMAAEEIDYLVVQSQQRFTSGWFRWFTDYPGSNFGITAVFPQDGEMTIISHGPNVPTPPTPRPDWAWRGVGETITAAAFPTVWWQDGWFAEKAVDVMMRKKPKTVGLVGLGNMSASMYENLLKGLEGVKIVNASDLVDEIRMVKSEEELKLHREAAYLHEMSYEVAKQAIKPGRLALEAIEEIVDAQRLAGSEEQQIVVLFGQPGSTVYTKCSWGSDYIRRAFQPGDVINILIESSVPCGYWYDMRRFMCIGPVPEATQEAYDITKEARRHMAAALVPGATPGDGVDASDKYLATLGCPPENRAAGHGQGIALVERPIISREDPAIIKAGMVVALHPTAVTDSALGCIADTYVITDAGAVPIYRNVFDDNEIVDIS